MGLETAGSKTNPLPKRIQSLEEYENAINILQECSIILLKNGWKTDIDNYEEDLSNFTLVNNQNSASARPSALAKRGFLSAKPPECVSTIDAIQVKVSDLTKEVAQKSFDKADAKKRKRDRTPDSK